MVSIDISFEGDILLPTRATPDSAGFDLYAYRLKDMDLPYELSPLEIVLVDTGITMAIPKGYEGQIRPRSGLALKHGITVVNTPGTIDADYRGTVGVPLINLGSQPFLIEKGMRIAQIVFNRVPEVVFNLVPREELGETSRKGGFGHTGVK